MPIEFKLPDLGEGIHEGEIVEVLVSVGDKVKEGQAILVVETDKASTEVPSPVTGTVREIKVQPGDVVNVGEVLIIFAKEGEAEKEVETETPSREPEKEKERIEESEKTEDMVKGKGPIPAAPSTRRLARELGVDLHKVEPSGPEGRVTADDIRAYAEGMKKTVETPTEPPGQEVKKPPKEKPLEMPRLAQVSSLPDFGQWGPVKRVPLRSIRRATAKRMTVAWSQIPHVTHQDLADITDLEALRRKYKSRIESQAGALTLTVFTLKATVAALKAHPRFNASLDVETEEIVLKQYYHIGVAVDTDRGLIVPVIRDVDRKSITELSRELHDLTEQTREGKTDREDLLGGTFTITNIGVLGGTGFTPIINYPQAAILGLGQARLQPIVRGDMEDYEIVPRLMLPLTLAFDHRVLDGADAARFLELIIQCLENPHRLMMVM